MSRRGFYIYENMDSWQRFNETSLPNKKEFYSNLSVEDIADSDFKHNMLQMVEKVPEAKCATQSIDMERQIIKT